MVEIFFIFKQVDDLYDVYFLVCVGIDCCYGDEDIYWVVIFVVEFQRFFQCYQCKIGFFNVFFWVIVWYCQVWCEYKVWIVLFNCIQNCLVVMWFDNICCYQQVNVDFYCVLLCFSFSLQVDGFIFCQ